MSRPAATVLALHQSAEHGFSKTSRPQIRLLAGLGVEGDAHAGVTVQHRSRVARDPTQPNLRQVHLLHAELLEELSGRGFDVAPGSLGENVTTSGLDLLGLPAGTFLRIGSEAVLEITGLRNPCQQINRFRAGLMDAVLDRDAAGGLVRKAGVMAIVRIGGDLRVGDGIDVMLPALPHQALQPV
ncbi:MAG: MOSC domain-containing protein [Ramlibacter sp.]